VRRGSALRSDWPVLMAAWRVAACVAETPWTGESGPRRRETPRLPAQSRRWTSWTGWAFVDAGRLTHNPEVAGSNPAPATSFRRSRPFPTRKRAFCVPGAVAKRVAATGFRAAWRRDGGDGATRDETAWTWWTLPPATAGRLAQRYHRHSQVSSCPRGLARTRSRSAVMLAAGCLLVHRLPGAEGASPLPPGLNNGVAARAVPMQLFIGLTHCATWLACVQPRMYPPMGGPRLEVDHEADAQTWVFWAGASRWPAGVIGLVPGGCAGSARPIRAGLVCLMDLRLPLSVWIRGRCRAMALPRLPASGTWLAPARTGSGYS
jgi:hypothetical protein